MVGDILKKKREELGLDLKEIARITKIKYENLKAIEEGDFGKISVEVYVRGYIREYAKILDIDPEHVIDIYIQETAPHRLSQTESIEILQKERSHSKGLKSRSLLLPVLTILILASILFLIFIFSSEKQTIPLPSVENQEALPPLAEQQETLLPPPEIQKENLMTTEKQTTPPSAEAKKEDSLKVEKATKVGNTKTLESTHHILKISAIDSTWVLADIDGTISKEILLQPGESVTWDAKNSFSLKIGNAGGIKLIFDGKEIGPLGEKGQVISLNLPSSSEPNLLNP